MTSEDHSSPYPAGHHLLPRTWIIASTQEEPHILKSYFLSAVGGKKQKPNHLSRRISHPDGSEGASSISNPRNSHQGKFKKSFWSHQERNEKRWSNSGRTGREAVSAPGNSRISRLFSAHSLYSVLKCFTNRTRIHNSVSEIILKL